MGRVHTHQGMFAIEGWGSLNCIQNDVEKIGKNNQKVGKTNQTISQVLTLGLKHDKIQA
jgi:hypothetical protein